MTTEIRDWAEGLEGRVLAGKYRVRALIGYGGMGAVFEADDVVLERRVAVKLLHPSRRGGGAEQVERFLREARAAARVVADGVVQVLDYGVDAGVGPFQVLELLVGESLADRLERGPLAPAEAVALMRALARTLARVHDAGIVHRDLKPANVFLEAAGAEPARPVLLDFGVAHIMSAESMTVPGAAIGTPGFMAPEQLRGAAVDRRTDLYALGVLLHTCLAGRPPFDGLSLAAIAAATLDGSLPSLRSQRPDLPEGLLRAVEAATAREASARVPDAMSFAHLLSGLPEAPIGPRSLRPPPDGARSPAAMPDAHASTLPRESSAITDEPAPAVPHESFSEREPAIPDTQDPEPPERASRDRGRPPIVAVVILLVLFAAGGGAASFAWWSHQRDVRAEAPVPVAVPAPIEPTVVEVQAAAPSSPAPRTPRVDVVFGEACAPRFEPPITLVHTAGPPLGSVSFQSIVDREAHTLTFALPLDARTLELSTQQAFDTGTVIMVGTAGGSFINRSTASLERVILGRSGPDVVRGTVVVHRFDPVSGALDVELRGVRLERADDPSQRCTLDGRVRSPITL